MTPREKIHFTLRYVAERFQMTEQTLLDQGDCEPVVAVRHMAFWLIREIVPEVIGLGALGRELKRDRTTIKSSLNQTRSKLGRSLWWRETAYRLRDEIRLEIERHNVIAFPHRMAQKERARETA